MRPPTAPGNIGGMAEIAELWIYPVKGLLGVSLRRAEVGPRGLKMDRHWMLVDSDGRFISQREDASLTQFRVRIDDDELEVEHPKFGCCPIPFGLACQRIEAHVWKADMQAQLVHPDIDAWFSRALGRECRLVVLPDDADRKVAPEYGDFPLGFADAMPILVLSEASVEDLNVRVFEEIPANRFRANILLRGTRPFEEDAAQSLVAGEVKLKATKRCGRCLVTCTDQETGEVGIEPLRTLAEYRQYGNNACMGMYFAPETSGRIEVGQKVDLRPRKDRLGEMGCPE